MTGWTKAQLNGREVWAAKVPWLAEASQPPLRSLWVNGRRGVRARSPNKGKGFFHVAAVAEAPDANGDWMKGVSSFRFAEADLKNWPGLKAGAEVMVMIRWVESRVPVTSVDEATHTVRFGKPTVFVVEKDDRYWVEGTPELLDEPGECILREVDVHAWSDLGTPPEGAPALLPPQRRAADERNGTF